MSARGSDKKPARIRASPELRTLARTRIRICFNSRPSGRPSETENASDSRSISFSAEACQRLGVLAARRGQVLPLATAQRLRHDVGGLASARLRAAAHLGGIRRIETHTRRRSRTLAPTRDRTRSPCGGADAGKCCRMTIDELSHGLSRSRRKSQLCERQSGRHPARRRGSPSGV